MTSKPQRILLAFSGGLDTSAILPWLKDEYQAEVIAYCSDLGNAPDEKHLKKWAFELGAQDFIFEDLKDYFAKDFAFKAVRAGATYQDDYLLGTALGRPVIAERMAYFAKKLNVTGVAHGATGKGNDQLRFEKSWAYLIPEVQVIAPWKIWNYTGRQDLLKYLSTKGFHLDSKEKIFSVDVNLFHRSCEGGVLEAPDKAYDPKDIYEWVKVPGNGSIEKTELKLSFEKGLPISINDKKMSPSDLLTQLNKVAGMHGIGVVDLVEERANGIKSRGVYETPGGTLLHLACKSLKHLCWDRKLMKTARILGEEFGELTYDGEWHSDSRRALDAYFDQACASLTGEVGLVLKGEQALVSYRNSPLALYDKTSVSFEEDHYNLLKHAIGFSKTVSFKNWLAGQRNARNGLQEVLKDSV